MLIVGQRLFQTFGSSEKSRAGPSRLLPKLRMLALRGRAAENMCKVFTPGCAENALSKINGLVCMIH